MNQAYDYIKSNFKVGDIIFYQPKLSMLYYTNHGDYNFEDDRLVTIYLKIDAITDNAIYFDRDWFKQNTLQGGLNHNVIRSRELNLYNIDFQHSALEWITDDNIIQYSPYTIVLLKSSNTNSIDEVVFKIYNNDGDNFESIKLCLLHEIEVLEATLHEQEESYKVLLSDQTKLQKSDFNKLVKNLEFYKCKDIIESILFYAAELQRQKNAIINTKRNLDKLKETVDELL